MKIIQFERKIAHLSVLVFLAVFSLMSSYGAAVPGDPRGAVTASMDGGATKAGNTWYESGVNTAAPATGLKTGTVSGQTDPLSSYLFESALGANALMLDASTKAGTLTFVSPVAVSALSLAGSSGNGGGTNILTLNFTDGTSTTLTNKVIVDDWFGKTPVVQTAAGRIDLDPPNAYANVSSADPRVLANNVTLPAALATKMISSINVSWTGGTSTHTAIFGVSGDTTGAGHFTPIELTQDTFNQDIIVGIEDITRNSYVQKNLISDLPGIASLMDTNLVNPWGIASSPSSPLWFADNHSGYSTLYSSASTGSIPGLIVTIPAAASGSGPGSPTGIIFNTTTNFNIASGGSNAPAKFIFATEDGTISAWASGTTALVQVDNSASNAVYKGLTLGTVGTNGATNFLYAANFNAGTVDVFDGDFNEVTNGFPLTTKGTPFADTNLPSGFAPFGIQAFGTNVYVTFALQDTNKMDDVKGPGNGYLDLFDTTGKLLKRFGPSTNSPFNSPWGVALAPASFGAFGGKLLVGNFGDGRINAFDPLIGTFLGPLVGTNGNPIAIQGLWGLRFGNGGSGGDTNALYFAAGIPGSGAIEDHGLVGSLRFQTNQVAGVPWELGQSVNGFQDDFTSTTRNTNWVASALGNPTPDQYQQAGGVLRVFPSAGDPNHLLYEAPGYSNLVQEVLARIRVVGFQTNMDGPRGGIGVGVTTNTPNVSRGIDLEFRDSKTPGDSNDSNQSGRKFKFLYDGVAWGPQGLTVNGVEMPWTNNVWYWMRLRQDPKAAGGTNDVFGKVWPSDGVTPEPADWQMLWGYTPAHPPLSTGFAGITGSSGYGFGQMEVDYILIKAAGLPSIKPEFGVFGPLPTPPLFTGITKTNSTVTINWFGGNTLQSATNVTGPFTAIPIPLPASSTTYSPFKVTGAATGQKFYRVEK